MRVKTGYKEQGERKARLEGTEGRRQECRECREWWSGQAARP